MCVCWQQQSESVSRVKFDVDQRLNGCVSNRPENCSIVRYLLISIKQTCASRFTRETQRRHRECNTQTQTHTHHRACVLQNCNKARTHFPYNYCQFACIEAITESILSNTVAPTQTHRNEPKRSPQNASR